ncbi:MAG: acyl-CoA/acyl-ACP dehydrogenase [Phenylobacterium sp.]|uniref:acyl-CoA dehydrogenase family protein n=1 Tax=Phenylobacterium sp. TaxID=1871053 RepID=UPI001A565443|nr:acyl-CoA dehydrogenase family protein [Phenylobacterium sp.]MBL8553997.1 acyl-CoA/acyl-ACP dehydrogenase [Phenylobacterium sp.]
MDFTRPEAHALIREGVRQVCRAFPDSYWSECDEQHRFPWAFYQAMAEGGWLGIATPETYGGAGQGITEASILLEEVAASGAAMNGASALHMSIFGMHPIVRFGSESLRRRFLPRVATGDLHVAFGVTEPDAGSETTRIATFASKVDGGYRVRGRKVWTSKALESERVLLLVRTTPVEACARRTDGLTLLFAELRRAEVDIRPIPKAGRNAVASCEVAYDGLFVSEEDRVGDEGAGFRYLLAGLNAERILVAAEALGIGCAALRRATDYARERVVFGRPVGQNQAVAFPLAEARMRLDAAELAIREASWRLDRGLDCGSQANRAKWLAAEAGYAAADAAVQTHGGFGYAREYHVERYWREARVMRLAPISQEMVLNYVAEHDLALPRAY